MAYDYSTGEPGRSLRWPGSSRPSRARRRRSPTTASWCSGSRCTATTGSLPPTGRAADRRGAHRRDGPIGRRSHRRAARRPSATWHPGMDVHVRPRGHRRDDDMHPDARGSLRRRRRRTRSNRSGARRRPRRRGAWALGYETDGTWVTINGTRSGRDTGNLDGHRPRLTCFVSRENSRPVPTNRRSQDRGTSKEMDESGFDQRLLVAVGTDASGRHGAALVPRRTTSRRSADDLTFGVAGRHLGLADDRTHGEHDHGRQNPEDHEDDQQLYEGEAGVGARSVGSSWGSRCAFPSAPDNVSRRWSNHRHPSRQLEAPLGQVIGKRSTLPVTVRRRASHYDDRSTRRRTDSIAPAASMEWCSSTRRRPACARRPASELSSINRITAAHHSFAVCAMSRSRRRGRQRLPPPTVTPPPDATRPRFEHLTGTPDPARIGANDTSKQRGSAPGPAGVQAPPTFRRRHQPRTRAPRPRTGDRQNNLGTSAVEVRPHRSQEPTDRVVVDEVAETAGEHETVRDGHIRLRTAAGARAG